MQGVRQRSRMNSASFEVILFDLGGVLVELGESPLIPEWLPEETGYSLNDWFKSETAILLEKGLISEHAFIEKFKADLNIDVDSNKIRDHFTNWPIGLFSGVDELLLKLKNNYILAILSNTNELHWPRITREFNIPCYFDHLFASHLLNMAKPDLSIFQYVISELNVKPEKILFFDDNLMNIDASILLGINGIHVTGLQETLKYLVKKGLINA